MPMRFYFGLFSVGLFLAADWLKNNLQAVMSCRRRRL